MQIFCDSPNEIFMFLAELTEEISFYNMGLQGKRRKISWG